MSRLSKPQDIKLVDDASERVRRSHAQAISELQTLPSSSMRIIANVQLPDSTNVPVPHGLGRVPVFVRESNPRNAVSTGRIDEIRDGTVDRSRYVVLRASGWGATIIIDVQVM